MGRVTGRGPAGRLVDWQRVTGVVLQSLYVMRHSPLRIMEVLYWPFIEVVLWGFITRYLQDTDAAIPGGVQILLGAVVFWDVCFRTQQEMAMTQLMDMWDRSILNIYASPIRQREYIAGAVLFSLTRVLVGSVLLSAFVAVAFGFNVLDLGSVLIPAFVLLVAFGWALGLLIRAAVLRFGSNAEVLAWSLALLLQPVCAVFYPVASLPGWLQAVAKGIPASYVFEALRAYLADGDVLASGLLTAGGLGLVYLAAGGLVLAAAYRSVRTRGLLSRPGY